MIYRTEANGERRFLEVILRLVRTLRLRRASLPVALLVVAALAGCDSTTPSPLAVDVDDGTPGHYGGPCNPDGTCATGLICEHHVCKEPGG